MSKHGGVGEDNKISDELNVLENWITGAQERYEHRMNTGIKKTNEVSGSVFFCEHLRDRIEVASAF